MVKSEKGEPSPHKEKTKAKPKEGGNKREQLLQFLDKNAFDPVIKVSEDKYNGGQRKNLQDVKATTKSTKERYHHNYKTAEDVKQNFENDQNSSAANQVDRELKDLGLPSLPGIHDEFMNLCNKLGVH